MGCGASKTLPADQVSLDEQAIAACDDGNAAALESLLKAGVAPNAADEDGWTPLLSAVENGHAECVTLLLASPSIDVNQADNDGATPLFAAAQEGQAECMTLLLASPSIAVNQARNNGVTPLIAASLSRSTAAALALIADERTCLLYTSPSPRD